MDNLEILTGIAVYFHDDMENISLAVPLHVFTIKELGDSEERIEGFPAFNDRTCSVKSIRTERWVRFPNV